MGFTPGDALGRLAKQAKLAASTLKSEYEAGKRGDDTPAAVLWSSPIAHFDAFLALLGSTRAQAAPVEAAEATEAAEAAEAAEVTRLLGEVDWAAVRESAGSRSADAVQAVKAMSAQVDWAKVQPVAAQASSALIAAVAAGKLPVGGRTGALVARAMLDQGGLGQRVGRQMAGQVRVSPDLRRAIDIVDSIVTPSSPPPTPPSTPPSTPASR
ncbi:MAG: hypothetical protein WCP59_02900 [Actinomycetota bacterium]